MPRIASFLSLLLLCYAGFAQPVSSKNGGIVTGNVMDEKKKAVEGATITVIASADSTQKQFAITDKDGEFVLSNLLFGVYKLRITHIGFATLLIDSMNFRKERNDFNIPDIVLKAGNLTGLAEVIVYAEKPLIESKEGNITFNAGESALSAGSNANELLTNVPLVTRDPASGKILVRGKEPKILIDDKPVELNLQQLQDLLESLSGSSIEKIEVMTNPPPQYANEAGGVINIVTKKGKVGRSGRLSVSTGTRGEASINGSFTYRKQGFALSINAGDGYSRYRGNSHSFRSNIYPDSVDFFGATGNYINKSQRPNFRLNIDDDLDKLQSINFVIQYNQNDFLNKNFTEYVNLNRFDSIYRLSDRFIRSDGSNYNPNASFTYSRKGHIAGEMLRVITGFNVSSSGNNRNFYQQYFDPGHQFYGVDSTQQQITHNCSNGYNVRVNYDRPSANYKTFLSLGGFYTRNNSHIITDASNLKKPDNIFIHSDSLSNNFRFRQGIFNVRASIKQMLGRKFSISGGLSEEATVVGFNLIRDLKNVNHHYWTSLPFATINKMWENDMNLTLSYRRSVRRPGINEQNPSIDFSDPYNLRFGNPDIVASVSHNFDLVVGKTKPAYFANIAVGYNIVQDIFSQVRTLLPDGRTQITWENISGRKEFEISAWNGYTLAKKLRINLSGSYIFSQYSIFDRTVNYYRNGGSFTSNFNTTYTPLDIWNFTGSFTFNRFASPQGYAKWNWSMNIGLQRKWFNKRLVVTVNIIDPFIEQQNRNYVYGSNFYLQSVSISETRNYRLSLAYNFTKAKKK